MQKLPPKNDTLQEPQQPIVQSETPKTNEVIKTTLSVFENIGNFFHTTTSNLSKLIRPTTQAPSDLTTQKIEKITSPPLEEAPSIEVLQLNKSTTIAPIKNIPKGIPNGSNFCYQNSVTRCLIHLMDEVGTASFAVYKAKDKDEYFYGLAKENLGEGTDPKELKAKASLYKNAFEAYEKMREEDKGAGITKISRDALTHAMFEIHFKKADEESKVKPNEFAQRDAEELFTQLYDLFGARQLPLIQIKKYHLNEGNLQIAEEQIKKLTKVEENMEKENPKFPLYHEQKYKFKENLQQQPENIKEIPGRIVNNVLDPKNKEKLSLEKLAFKPHTEMMDSFGKGQKVLVKNKVNEFEEKEKNLPLEFPDSDDRKENLYDIKDPVQVITTEVKTCMLQVDVLPDSSVLQLGRVYYDDNFTQKKHHTSIEVNQNIEIDLVSNTGEKTGTLKQDLISVCLHSGSTPFSGHWTSFVRKDDKWYYCDDKSVTEISDKSWYGYTTKWMTDEINSKGTLFFYKTEAAHTEIKLEDSDDLGEDNQFMKLEK